MNRQLWGIDLGGTKIEGVILESADNPVVVYRNRLPTEAEKGYDHVINQIDALVNDMKRHAGFAPARIGIGTPGTIDPATRLLKNSNSVKLNDKPLKDDLENRLQLSVLMANDANCFALAETKMGVVHEVLPQAEVVFGVIIGTGVGGGIVVNGKVLNGLHGIAGEWGHNFLDESGGPCYCGKSGCVEKILAGPSLESFYQNLTGLKKTLKEIYILSQTGTDEAAVQTMQRLTHFFGLGLSVVLNILDPDVVVIGGGVGNIDAIYTAGVDSLRRHLFNNRLETPVLKPKLGDSAGVFGAAFLGQF
ncbi:MAG: ROK family protein [Flammeovirgaceae bacterium]|nr:MAG: ROK family protein [Flammeovirgaceae bacterium]